MRLVSKGLTESIYSRVKSLNLNEATDEEMAKLKDELQFRYEELSNSGDIEASLIGEDIDAIANKIRQEGFFISNDIFTDDSDEYEWEQINMFLDQKIREYVRDNYEDTEAEAQAEDRVLDYERHGRGSEEQYERDLRSLDEGALAKVYYFIVGICLDGNRPDADKNDFYDMPDFGIPFKLMDENIGVTSSMSEAYNYARNYVTSGVDGTFGAVIENNEPTEGFADTISSGFSDNLDSSDIYHFKENGGKLTYCAYSTENGSIETLVDDYAGSYKPSPRVISKLNNLYSFVSDKNNRELFNSDGIDEEIVSLVKDVLNDIMKYDTKEQLVNSLNYIIKYINDTKEYFYDGIDEEIIADLTELVDLVNKDNVSIKESADVYDSVGKIENIDGKEYYVSDSTFNGYCYKNANTYNSDPNGVCYITEAGFENDDKISVEEVEANKAKLIEEGTISTKNSIMDEVRTMFTTEEYYYEYDDGRRIEAKDFDEKLIEKIADDAFNVVDWQTVNGFLLERDWNEAVEEFYNKKPMTEGAEYVEVDHKSVPDSDGFTTEYTMYKDNNGKYVFVFGDRDIYKPEDGNFDWEAETEEEAREWFDNYTGFSDMNESEKPGKRSKKPGKNYTYDELEDIVAEAGENSEAQVVFDDLGYKSKTDELLDLVNSKKFKNKSDIIDFIATSKEVEKLRESESKKPGKKSKKEKKDEKRVIMQQGNVTCFKENDNKYLVFENENDNEVEYRDQDSAMVDFMNRVGIDPDNGDSLKESVTTYNIWGDIVVLDTDNKKVIVNDKEFSFDRMNEFVKMARGANRMHKPGALLLYTDYKNGKIKNWSSNIVK